MFLNGKEIKLIFFNEEDIDAFLVMVGYVNLHWCTFINECKYYLKSKEMIKIKHTLYEKVVVMAGVSAMFSENIF